MIRLIMGKKTTTPPAATMKVEGIFNEQEDDLVLFEEQGNDISYWEIINPSDADDSDNDSLISLENGFVTMYAFNPSSPPKSPETNPEEHQSQITPQDLVVADPVISTDYGHHGTYGYKHDGYGLDDKKHGDDEEADEVYGLDDELVPWQVSGKLGRQRMRKLGKRMFSKMSHSKRNPYRYVKPGCVYGKHGLGINA